MKKNWESTIDIDYVQTCGKNNTTIAIDFDFVQPTIWTEQGQIQAEIVYVNNQWTFTFGLNEIAPMDGISTYIFIVDQEQEFRLCTSSTNAKSGYKIRKQNFNNIVGVWYTEQYVFYFRNTASAKGRLTFQRKIRLSHETPAFGLKQRIAHKLFRKVVRNEVLVFEKELMQFEESGARLFEKIAKYPNVYFVIDKQSPAFPSLRTQYNNQIVEFGSLKYLRLIHTAKYYIGTELPMHLIGLRSPYKSLRLEIMNSAKHKFIFLQHGVTQSLSLAGPERAIFRKNFIYSPYKVIVSSAREADHFVNVGKYQPEDLWNIGLSTFDNKQLKESANKISIMLTWRPWDQMKSNINETSYYQALISIVNSIEDKQHLQIILHPKATEQLSEIDPLYQYVSRCSVNAALSQTSLFITDYSSAVFDSFYRGSNVIFWWNEKDQCLVNYDNSLLLTEENAFGDIVYHNSELNDVIINNYNVPQKQKYIDKYRLFVEHHDNQNTERLVQNLRLENIIK